LLRRTQFAGQVEALLLEAMAEARTALGLDDRDPWAHLAHGVALFRVRRYGEAERALRRALEFNPNLALAHAYLAWPLAVRGAHEEALKSAEHALRLSPNDPLVGAQGSYSIAIAHFAAGRYLDCVASARETTERYPEYIPGHYTLAAAADAERGCADGSKVTFRPAPPPTRLLGGLDERGYPVACRDRRALGRGLARSRDAGGMIGGRKKAEG